MVRRTATKYMVVRTNKSTLIALADMLEEAVVPVVAAAQLEQARSHLDDKVGRAIAEYEAYEEHLAPLTKGTGKQKISEQQSERLLALYITGFL